MFLESIQVSNLLSFGSQGTEINLGPLNILIGPNGSGKSNLLECIALLQAAPKDLTEPIRIGGGIVEWLFKGGNEKAIASIETTVNGNHLKEPIRYAMKFRELDQHFELVDERPTRRRLLKNQHLML